MKTKKVLKRLGDADRALGKLANLTAKACLTCFIREWATRFDFEGLVAAS
jgi:hypothetical protein